MKPAELRHRCTRHRIRESLQNRILGGELAPGQRLTQLELADEFGVAQSVVRESLLELQFCGLVKIVDNLGVFVSELSPGTLLEAYQIREMFEGLAARLTCDTAGRRDLQELRDLAGGIRQCGRDQQFDRMGRLDRQFHQRIIAIAGNDLMNRLTAGYRFLGLIVRAKRNMRTVHREHLGIIDAIEKGDAEEAESRARQHVRAARLALRKMVQDGTFEPNWIIPDESATELSQPRKEPHP